MEKINKQENSRDVNSIFPFEFKEGRIVFNEQSSTYSEVLRIMKKAFELIDINQIIKKL
ncbi:MAG: hypothetical protein QM654_00970 [Dysgonamonadaceae bacterium]